MEAPDSGRVAWVRSADPHTKHIEKEVQKAVSDQNARFLMSDLAGDLVSVKVRGPWPGVRPQHIHARLDAVLQPCAACHRLGADLYVAVQMSDVS